MDHIKTPAGISEWGELVDGNGLVIYGELMPYKGNDAQLKELVTVINAHDALIAVAEAVIEAWGDHQYSVYEAVVEQARAALKPTE